MLNLQNPLVKLNGMSVGMIDKGRQHRVYVHQGCRFHENIISSVPTRRGVQNTSA